MDIAIVVLLVGFTVYGSMSRFSRSICSLLVPVVGIWLALKSYGLIAPGLNQVIHCWPVSAIVCFILVIAAVWLGALGARVLLRKLVDWGRVRELDLFLGGIFGLARGMALVWLTVAIVLAVFPPSVGVIERSMASTRLLAIAEHLAGNSLGRGRTVRRIQDASGTVARSVSTLGQVASPFGGTVGN
jgi:uncharacterized membrane protein required for colicin V production